MIPSTNKNVFDVIDIEQQTIEENLAFKERAADRLNKACVLLVDDISINLKLLSGLMKRMGFDIEGVEDGQSGLDKCNQRKYDLILTDIHMPYMDGIQMVRKIRTGYSQNAKTPVVGVTADTSPELKKHCLNEGFDAWIQKPVKKDVLVDTIQLVMSSL